MINKVLMILVFVLYLVLAPITTSGHYTGFTHHELTFDLMENRLIANYGIVLEYSDFKKIYPVIDSDKNDIVDETEAAKWLEIWDNRVSVQIGDKQIYPEKLTNFSNLNQIKSNLFPSLAFRIDFGEIGNISNWDYLKTNHSYRISEDPKEYFTIGFNPANLDFYPVSEPQELFIEGKFKGISTVTRSGNNDQQDTPKSWFLPAQLYKYIQSLFNNQDSFNNSLFLILLGFLIGILHSLSPGHGKTIMGTYIAVTNSSIPGILLLATSITISHILIVATLSILFIWLRAGLSIELLGINLNLNFDIKAILPYLSSLSGLIVFMIGLVLIFRHLKPNQKSSKSKKRNNKSFFSLNSNYAVLDEGDHSHKIPRFKMDAKQSLMLGISTGLVPCVEVVSLLILAINMEKVWSGIAVLVSFSVGMGFTLTLLGWLMKNGLDRSQNMKSLEKFYKNIPIISAILIMLSGIFTIFWGLNN